MKIGIIGAGNVGGTLGKRWAASGHDIKFGVRAPADKKISTLLAECGARASAGSIAEAAAFGEVIALTTPWDAAKSAIGAVGKLSGKILVDCTNPVAVGGNVMAGLAIGHTTSAAEEVARWANGAKVVKAFNTTGADNMANPRYGSDQAVMFIAGDDAHAKNRGTELSNEHGLQNIDAGPLRQTLLQEPPAMPGTPLTFHQGL